LDIALLKREKSQRNVKIFIRSRVEVRRFEDMIERLSRRIDERKLFSSEQSENF